MSEALRRYARQVILPDVGEEGQRLIGAGHVVVVGLGALGCSAADMLARAGVGRLTLVDRDVVEWTNLQRQTLYCERDARGGVPKPEAAAARIGEINSGVACEPVAVDVTPENAERAMGLAGGGAIPGVLLDATDNLETRFLLNDISVKHAVPLVYGGVLATRGMHATFVPGPGSACLRCVFDGPGVPGSTPTCDTAGVLGSAVATVAAAQATDAIKLLMGRADLVRATVTDFDLWTGHHRVVNCGAADPACPCCGLRRYEFLGAVGPGDSASLCGQDAVQVNPMGRAVVDLGLLAERLAPVGRVECTRFMLRFTPREGALSLSIFTDGRAIVHGTARPEVARSAYARFVGA